MALLVPSSTTPVISSSLSMDIATDWQYADLKSLALMPVINTHYPQVLLFASVRTKSSSPLPDALHGAHGKAFLAVRDRPSRGTRPAALVNSASVFLGATPMLTR